MSMPTVDFLSVDQLQSMAAAPESACTDLSRVFAAVRSSDEETRNGAVDVLENIEEPPTDVLSELVSLLKTDSISDAYWACRLIGRMGDRGAAAEPVLCVLLSNAADMTIREEAASALGKFSVLADTTCIALASAAEKGSPRLTRLCRAALSK